MQIGPDREPISSDWCQIPCDPTRNEDGVIPLPRVLLMAVACSPKRGSEAGVGWNRALQSARFFDTWVVTEDGGYADEIRDYLATHGEIHNLHFVYIANGVFGGLLRRFSITYYISYHLWHRRAFQVVKRMHEKLKFDLSHQLTYCGYREPGFAWKLPIPSVWGPVGGTQNYPWQFLGCTDWRGALKEASRSILNSLQLRFSIGVRKAVRNTTVLLVANESIRADFKRVLGVSPQVRLEIGTQSVRDSFPPRRMKDRPLRLLWSGELGSHKALSLLIEAMAEVPSTVPLQLRVLGKGRLKKRWMDLAKKRGVSDRVEWLGWLAHEQALSQYEWADVFVFTSLRDTTGTVVLEALANGVPVICLDHQGVGDLVTDECGIKIAPISPRNVIADLAGALCKLEEAPELVAQLSRGAIERARKFLWERQGNEMETIYRLAIQKFKNPPDRSTRTLSEAASKRGNDASGWGCEKDLENEGVTAESGIRISPKILVFAYSCHPTFSMESRVGWYRALNAASRFETYVLYGDNFTQEQLMELAQDSPNSKRIHFIRVNHTLVGKRLLRLPGCFYMVYSCWQHRAYRHAVRLQQEIDFDLVHQVNFCGFREPGLGWKLKAPFFWGPIGGTQNFPIRFLKAADLWGGFCELFRNAVNSIQLRASRRVRAASRMACKVFAANSTAQRDLKNVLGIDSELQLEIGISSIYSEPKGLRDCKEPLKILWAGRLRTWKCLPLLLHALAKLPNECPFELRVLGEGGCLNLWKRLSKRLGIAERIQWCGWPPYEESLPHYRWADIFAFTSLRDTSGTGLLESLAAGTPIVGLDHQGLADIIRHDCGIPVEVTNPEDVANQFQAIIMELAASPERIELLGIGALRRAHDYRWEKLAFEMDRHYSQIEKVNYTN